MSSFVPAVKDKLSNLQSWQAVQEILKSEIRSRKGALNFGEFSEEEKKKFLASIQEKLKQQQAFQTFVSEAGFIIDDSVKEEARKEPVHSAGNPAALEVLTRQKSAELASSLLETDLNIQSKFSKMTNQFLPPPLRQVLWTYFLFESVSEGQRPVLDFTQSQNDHEIKAMLRSLVNRYNLVNPTQCIQVLFATSTHPILLPILMSTPEIVVPLFWVFGEALSQTEFLAHSATVFSCCVLSFSKKLIGGIKSSVSGESNSGHGGAASVVSGSLTARASARGKLVGIGPPFGGMGSGIGNGEESVFPGESGNWEMAFREALTRMDEKLANHICDELVQGSTAHPLSLFFPLLECLFASFFDEPICLFLIDQLIMTEGRCFHLLCACIAMLAKQQILECKFRDDLPAAIKSARSAIAWPSIQKLMTAKFSEEIERECLIKDWIKLYSNRSVPVLKSARKPPSLSLPLKPPEPIPPFATTTEITTKPQSQKVIDPEENRTVDLQPPPPPVLPHTPEPPRKDDAPQKDLKLVEPEVPASENKILEEVGKPNVEIIAAPTVEQKPAKEKEPEKVHLTFEFEGQNVSLEHPPHELISDCVEMAADHFCLFAPNISIASKLIPKTEFRQALESAIHTQFPALPFLPPLPHIEVPFTIPPGVDAATLAQSLIFVNFVKMEGVSFPIRFRLPQESQSPKSLVVERKNALNYSVGMTELARLIASFHFFTNEWHAKGVLGCLPSQPGTATAENNNAQIQPIENQSAAESGSGSGSGSDNSALPPQSAKIENDLTSEMTVEKYFAMPQEDHEILRQQKLEMLLKKEPKNPTNVFSKVVCLANSLVDLVFLGTPQDQQHNREMIDVAKRKVIGKKKKEFDQLPVSEQDKLVMEFLKIKVDDLKKNGRSF